MKKKLTILLIICLTFTMLLGCEEKEDAVIINTVEDVMSYLDENHEITNVIKKPSNTKDVLKMYQFEYNNDVYELLNYEEESTFENIKNDKITFNLDGMTLTQDCIINSTMVLCFSNIKDTELLDTFLRIKVGGEQTLDREF